jgi:hypothetical protein
MKAYKFEGDKGKEVIQMEIPETHKAEAEKYRTELVEKIVENDDAMMAEYLEGKLDFPIDELKKVLRKAVIKNAIFPVYAGSALKNKGVQLVLDAVVDYLPSPMDIPPTAGIDPKTGETITRETKDSFRHSLSKLQLILSLGNSFSSVFIQEHLKLVLMFIMQPKKRKSVSDEYSECMQTNVKKLRKFMLEKSPQLLV